MRSKPPRCTNLPVVSTAFSPALKKSLHRSLGKKCFCRGVRESDAFPLHEPAGFINTPSARHVAAPHFFAQKMNRPAAPLV